MLTEGIKEKGKERMPWICSGQQVFTLMRSVLGIPIPVPPPPGRGSLNSPPMTFPNSAFSTSSRSEVTSSWTSPRRCQPYEVAQTGPRGSSWPQRCQGGWGWPMALGTGKVAVATSGLGSLGNHHHWDATVQASCYFCFSLLFSNLSSTFTWFLLSWI